ncbi:DUF7507 domain-containing protein [Tabrizicola sp.]|uniref:DUF7507 domain-containing protein n=1 Tax=Tabrizicola sp. TaxID=2005166 RepID=UPI002FDD7B69
MVSVLVVLVLACVLALLTPRRAARRLSRVAGIAILTLFSATAAATAQDVDWVTNINDAGSDPTPAGGLVTYQVTVTNNGFDDAPGNTLQLIIPASTVLESASGTITGCSPLPATGPATVTCTVPPLADSASASVTAGVRTTVQGSVVMGARVPTIAPETNAANNDVTETTTVTEGADIGLTVTGPATASSGSIATYSFTATNNGPDPVTNFTFTVPIPTGLTNTSAPAGCTLAGSTYSCTVAGTIPVGSSVSRDITGQIFAAAGSTLTVAGSVQMVTPSDPITANNTATFNTTVTAGSDLSIAKSRAPSGSVFVGDPVVFTLSAQYSGDPVLGPIVITDTIPANYGIVSVTPSAGSGWSCTTTGQQVQCTRASGAGPGANVSLGSIEVATTALTVGSPVNTASITSAGPVDPVPGNNTASDGGATISQPTADLRANKSGPSPALAVIGNSYDWRIGTTNLGNRPFVGTVVMTDTLPAGLDLTSIALSGWTCSPASGTGPLSVTCSRDYTAGAPLGVGESTPEAVLTTLVTAAGTLTNGLSVTSPNPNFPDPDLGNNTIDVGVGSVVPEGAADLSVTKSAAPGTVVAGDVETFTIQLTNAGPVTSQSVTLSDDLLGLINSATGPTGAGVVSYSLSPGNTTGGSCAVVSTGGTSARLDCSFTAVPVCSAATCATVTVSVRPGGDGGLRTNSASAISSVTPDNALGNNSGSATFTVTPRADVTVAKTATPNPSVAGQTLTYVVTATNIANGLSSAEAVRITDTLPAGLTFVSATPSTGSCTTPSTSSPTALGNDTIVCNFGTLGNGAQQTVTILVRPNDVTRGTTITNGVTVATDTPETDTTNNSDSVDTEVEDPVLDLLINKTDSVDPVAVGDDTVYTITARNNGPSAAENFNITDTLPADRLTFVSVSAPGGSCGTLPAVGSLGGTITCTFGTVPAGEERVMLVTMRGAAKGSTTNVATVSSDEVLAGFESNPLNNTEDEVTTVRTRTDIELVSKVASPASVNLRDPFTWTILVRNNAGALLAEADGTNLVDDLPPGMELTGPPTISTTDSTPAASCTGAAGGTSFTCSLNTFASGGTATITVPVRVVSIAISPQTRFNTASVGTSSRDINPDNNTNFGSVVVNASSIAGVVFRDFADDGAITTGDTFVGGVTMTLSGTALDGTSVSQTVTTAPDGSYLFPLLPEGSYTITRGAVDEPRLADGQTSAGTAGGTVSSPTVIGAITLPGNTAATGYLYPLVPQASVGIAKRAGAVTLNADGSFNVPFTLVVENLSLEALDAVTVADDLDGAAPLFGTQVSLASPATDPLAAGSYTLLSAPSGTCGGLNAGFNGAGAPTVASGFSLAIGASCQIDFALRVQPTAPLPPVLPSGGRYENQATVDAVGALSGQTSATNPQLRDLSDDGADPDPNGNRAANEAGENDPTPVIPAFAPSIALVKRADTSGLSTPVVPGEPIVYTLEVTNTGNVTLTGVTVSDPLLGGLLAGGPITLAPGQTDSTTFTGTYAVTQDDINDQEVVNQAVTQGTDPFGTVVDDDSGTAVDNDIPLVTPLVQTPSITLVKTADASGIGSPTAVGEVITYSFTVQNTGNVPLTNIFLTDPLPDVVLSGGPISLAPGESNSTAFTATYAVTQADINAGEVRNRATATGTSPAGVDVSDESGTDPTLDEDTVVPLGQGAAIELDKIADISGIALGAVAGDQIPYTFVVTNAGNVTLTGITLADVLPGVTITGGPIASLDPGGVDGTTFTATYTITPDDIAAGEVVNTATVTGHYGPGGSLSVIDDDTEIAPTIAIEAIPEVFPPFTTNGGTTTSMLASDTVAGQPATLDNVTIRVLGSSNPGVTLDPATGLITLAPGLPAGPYTVDYEICSVVVPTVCDTTTETVYQAPVGLIETTKTLAVTDNGDGIRGVGDLVTFTITVENLSNTSIADLALTDTFTTMAGAGLTLDSGPTFVSASAGSPEGTLAVGETATYTATFTLTVEAVSGGGVRNSVTADGETVVPPGLPPSVVPVPVSDVSDDGDDTDGNTVDDPTELVVDPSLAPTGLSLTKTTPRSVVTRGSVVPYTITVRNDNPVVSGQLDIVDVLPPGMFYIDGTATLGGVPVDVQVQGRIITWPDVPVPPLTTVVATLQARVTNSASAGDLVNVASLRNPETNGLLAERATAVVRIEPEGVFDCGDVIGKVFDDRNRDGYQNPPKGAPVTEDAYDPGGKYGKYGGAPAVVEDDGTEPGLAGVRLVGVDGTVITTDAFGRYSVPCAMLPADRGSNFILKLDTRSLPAGYRVTTENPLVMRLTPGKMVEMNFGASIGKVVRIDLNANAFVSEGGSAALAPGLVAGIGKLLPQIAGEAPTLRLSYFIAKNADAAGVKRAKALMDLVERHIRREWREVGRTKLTIEKTVVRNDG